MLYFNWSKNLGNLGDALVIYFPYVWQIIEEGETRFGDETRFGEVSKELAELVEKTLPPPPTDPESEAGINEGKEETENEEHNVETKGEEQTKERNDDGKEETVVGELMDTSWGHICANCWTRN